MSDSATGADNVAASNRPFNATPPDTVNAAVRRQAIGADLARTVLEAAARRLSDAIAEFDAALDRRASMFELQFLDRETASAQRDRDLADRQFRAATHGRPGDDASTPDPAGARR